MIQTFDKYESGGFVGLDFFWSIKIDFTFELIDGNSHFPVIDNGNYFAVPMTSKLRIWSYDPTFVEKNFTKSFCAPPAGMIHHVILLV